MFFFRLSFKSIAQFLELCCKWCHLKIWLPLLTLLNVSHTHKKVKYAAWAHHVSFFFHFSSSVYLLRIWADYLLSHSHTKLFAVALTLLIILFALHRMLASWKNQYLLVIFSSDGKYPNMFSNLYAIHVFAT